MPSVRSAATNANVQPGREAAAAGTDADVDGLAGFPTTDRNEKPEQLTLDFGDELSLFTRVLIREPRATPMRAGDGVCAAAAPARLDVSRQEAFGLLQSSRWGR